MVFIGTFVFREHEEKSCKSWNLHHKTPCVKETFAQTERSFAFLTIANKQPQLISASFVTS